MIVGQKWRYSPRTTHDHDGYGRRARYIGYIRLSRELGSPDLRSASRSGNASGDFRDREDFWRVCDDKFT